MRFEIERNDHRVASVLWEGPGQVVVRAADPTDADRIHGFLGQEVVYLASGPDGRPGGEGLAARRRDGNPFEFERQVRTYARTIGATARRVPFGPVEEVASR